MSKLLVVAPETTPVLFLFFSRPDLLARADGSLTDVGTEDLKDIFLSEARPLQAPPQFPKCLPLGPRHLIERQTQTFRRLPQGHLGQTVWQRRGAWLPADLRSASSS